MIRPLSPLAALVVAVPGRFQEKDPSYTAKVARAMCPFVEPDVRIAVRFDSEAQTPVVLLHSAEGPLGPILDRVCAVLGIKRGSPWTF